MCFDSGNNVLIGQLVKFLYTEDLFSFWFVSDGWHQLYVMLDALQERSTFLGMCLDFFLNF